MRHPVDTTPDNAPLEEIVATGGFSDISRYEYAADIERLRNAVVDAAKNWRKGRGLAYRDDNWHKMLDAVDALIQFESKEG